MRHIKISRSVLLLLCCFSIHLSATAQSPRVSLKDAIDKHLVVLKSAKATDKGSSDKGIELSLVNITCDNIVIDIDPGLVLRGKAKGAPEMVIASSESVSLAPEKPQKLAIATFFTANDRREPVAGEKYLLHKQNESLVKLLGYINQHHIGNRQAQNAILAVTDGASLASVYDAKKPKTSKRLQKFITSSIKASSSDEVTRKFAAYRPPPVADTKMVITLDMNYPSHRNLNIRILDKDGFVYSNMHKKEYVTDHSRSIDVELDTAQMPHGTYYVSVRDDDNKVWHQKVITV